MIDIASLHESFGLAVQTACLCALPVVFWSFCVAWLHEHDIYILRRLRGMFKGLNGVLAAIAIFAIVVWAGTKPDMNPLPRLDLNPAMQQLQQPGDGATGTNETSAAVGEFVLESATTNVVHDFSMPTNAMACERWMRRGAARDSFSITNDLAWAFPFGTSVVRRITISSTGAMLVHPDVKASTNANERAWREMFDPRRDIPMASSLLAPLRANLGVVPLHNWGMSGNGDWGTGNGDGSLFWHCATSSNTLLMTWSNVLLGRSPEKPISLQVELMPSGRFRFAYDMTAVTADDLTTNVLSGAFCGDCRVSVAPPPGAVSVFDFRAENPVDIDGDGLNDAEETLYGTDPEMADTDGDGLDDHDEVARGTNPLEPDSDADGLSDGEEVALGSNPLVADTDGDGLGDGLEAEAYGSNPLAADTDGDGIGDAAEVTAGTSPILADTDGDGLSDLVEQTAGTNPLLKDTDGDGATDGEEVAVGSNPLVADTDGDGLADGQELNVGSSPLLVDTDGDGFTDPKEVAMGADPASADTDGDGIPDRDEVDHIAVRETEWLDASGGAVLMDCLEPCAIYDGLVATNLCSPVDIGGRTYDRVVVDLNGHVHLVPTNGVPSLDCTSGWNPDPADIAPGSDDIVVAGFWENLALRQHLGSKILFAENPSNGCTVVQYENGGIANALCTNSCLTFQIAIGGDTNFPIRVNYHAFATNEYFHATPTLGVVGRGRVDFRNHARCQRLIYSYGSLAGFSVPLSLGYRLGTGTDPGRADTDGDGLGDGDELSAGTSPWNPDSDGDGLSDGDEIDAGTDPLDSDSDNDGMPDGWEVEYALNPLQNDSSLHADSDGLTNLREYQLGTDPTKNDTDGDGLNDNVEVDCGMSPVNADTDGDGLDDYAECHGGTSATNADTDGDGMPDGWEVAHNLSATLSYDIHGASGDPDGDGLTNIEECRLGTNPRNPDTDGDGIPDCEELGYTRCSASGAEWASATNGWTTVEAAETGEIDGIGFAYYDFYDSGLHIGHEHAADFVVQENGVMFFNTDDHYEEGLIDYGPFALPMYGLSDAALLLAPCWVSAALSNTLSSVCVLCRTNGLETFIAVQHEGMRLLGSGTNTLAVQAVLAFSNGVFRSSEFAYRDVSVDSPSEVFAGVGVQNRTIRKHQGFDIEQVLPNSQYSILRVAGTGTNPAKEDSDEDGLTDAEERALGTDPSQPDTDGDGMNDGWEHSHGFNPRVDNAADGDPTNDYGYDRDRDGLTNGEECDLGTNPNSADTDLDDVADKDEVDGGSDPLDSGDGGIPASRVPVSFTFGDPSGSSSEKYRLVLSPVSGSGSGDTPQTKSWLNENYGECETKTAMLVKGWTYEIRLHHAGTNIEDGSPDYDYLLSWRVPSCCGCVTDDPDGLICADYTSNSFAGEGKVAKILVLDGGIWADYDRANGIDNSDKSKAYCGKSFRHWYNDDDDEGATNEGAGDIPAANSTPDCANNHVDGKCDVLDFTPVWIDMGRSFQQLAGFFKNCSAEDFVLTLSQADGAVNLVWTSLTKETVANFLKTDVGSCGSLLNSNLAAADTVHLTKDELELPDNFINLMKNDRNSGVALIEGRSPDGDSSIMSISPIILRVYKKPRASDASPLCELCLPLRLSSVERMYNVSNIRSACGDSTQIPGVFGGNIPDGNGTTVFFLHGFNVSANDSRAWFSEMFKRLWQSGSNAGFCGVGWYGDYNLADDKFNSMHYHRDVYNALQSASAFANLVGGTSGNKMVIAHSLGNMVVSKAIKDGLAVGKYFMLDAAIPSEAFDATLQDETLAVRRKYVPSAWRSYHALSWAANWHRWFPEDDRGKLKWRGAFADVPDLTDVYNYYSDGDEVFEEQNDVPTKYSRLFHWPTFKASWPFVETSGMLTPATSAWQKQEVLKGIDLLFGTLDGGWGFHCWRSLIPPIFQTKRYTAEEANAMVQNGSIVQFPVFDRGESAMFSAIISETNINHILAYNIPAISSATGKIPVIKGKSETFNLNLNSPLFQSNEWGRRHPVYKQRWLHSDVKDMTFHCVYKLFEDMVMKGTLK